MFKYPWQDLVLQAFGAPPDLISEKVAVAQEAITTRLADPNQPDVSERAELNNALIALRAFAEPYLSNQHISIKSRSP